jgi:hypothetical protein
MLKLLAVAVGLVMLSGCGTLAAGLNRATGTQLIQTHSTVYPDLPDVEIPDPPRTRPVTFDVPRDLNGTPTLRNTPECTRVPLDQRSEAFWSRCGDFPIDRQSNLLVGLDEQGVRNLTYNREAQDSYTRQLRRLLREENRQREVWRERNRANREREARERERQRQN